MDIICRDVFTQRFLELDSLGVSWIISRDVYARGWLSELEGLLVSSWILFLGMFTQSGSLSLRVL